jgi:hypothetical protein
MIKRKNKSQTRYSTVQKRRLLLLKRATNFWNEDTVAMNVVKNREMTQNIVIYDL